MKTLDDVVGRMRKSLKRNSDINLDSSKSVLEIIDLRNDDKTKIDFKNAASVLKFCKDRYFNKALKIVINVENYGSFNFRISHLNCYPGIFKYECATKIKIFTFENTPIKLMMSFNLN